MYIVGIDLSINYPAFCVTDNFETFEFFGFVNDPRISEVKLNYILSESEKYDGMKIAHIAEDERKTVGTYHIDERNKLINFHKIVSRMVMEIGKLVDKEKTIVAMEGISYGSKGAALIDICMLTGMFRRAILTEVVQSSANRFFVFAPSELKNAIGLKGNATKTEVLAQFMDDPGMDCLAGEGFHKFMTDHVPTPDGENDLVSDYVYNGKRDEIGSPFNDMIDAYLSVLKIRQNVG